MALKCGDECARAFARSASGMLESRRRVASPPPFRTSLICTVLEAHHSSDMSPIALEPTIVTSPPAKAMKGDDTATARPQAKHEELQYLDLIRDILENGEHRPDR